MRIVSAVTATRRVFSSSARGLGGHGHGHGHESHFGGEPSGYFLGDPQSTKAKYFWAPVYLWGYLGGTAVFLTAYAVSPNKSPSQVAKTEALKRIAESGESFGWPLPPDSLTK